MSHVFDLPELPAHPTVGIYLEGELVEIYVLMGTETERLRDFVLALAVLLDGCKSQEQVRAILKMPHAGQDFLKELERDSEAPFIVDLTSRAVYCNYHPMNRETLERTRLLDLGRSTLLFEEGQFGIPGRYIPFEALPVKEIRASHAYWHLKNK